MIRWFPLVLVACISDQGWQGGTGVGNPGTTKLTMARVDGLTLTAASGVLATLEVERCRGRVAPTAVGEAVDLLDSDTFRVAGGRWCALVARFEPPLSLDGIDGDGADPESGTFSLALEVQAVRVEVDRRLVVDRDALVLELGDREWIDEGEHLAGLEDDTHVDVAPGDPAHADLVTGIEERSALFLDADRDGTIDDAERSAGPLASGPSWSADDE